MNLSDEMLKQIEAVNKKLLNEKMIILPETVKKMAEDEKMALEEISKGKLSKFASVIDRNGEINLPMRNVKKVIKKPAIDTKPPKKGRVLNDNWALFAFRGRLNKHKQSTSKIEEYQKLIDILEKIVKKVGEDKVSSLINDAFENEAIDELHKEISTHRITAAFGDTVLIQDSYTLLHVVDGVISMEMHYYKDYAKEGKIEDKTIGAVDYAHEDLMQDVAYLNALLNDSPPSDFNGTDYE